MVEDRISRTDTMQMDLENELKEAQKRIDRIEYESQKLLDAASAVLRSESFPQAARAVFNIAKDLTGAKSGYVALLSEDGEENKVLFLDSGGLPCTVDENLPMPIRGLREVAYREARPAYDNSFMGSQWVKYMPEGHVFMKNVMFGPLIISNKVEGIIGLANKPSDFTQDDERVVMALSNLVAIGLRRSKIEEELRISRTRLEDTVTELQLYASLLRHDLANDLQLIIGEIGLVLERGVKNSKDMELFSSIDSAAKRMLRLIQHFNRSDFIEEDNLIDIIRHLENEAKSSYPSATIHVHDKLPEHRITTKGKSLLPFVFDNLVRNAVQHVGPEMELDIHLFLDKKKAILDFVDNGPGVDPEIATHLFEKGVSDTGGGLGLYLSRKIVEIYQGNIFLLESSVYNKGAAIRIELPYMNEEVRERTH